MTRPLAVIPARDEKARLPTALKALRTADVDVIVVANGCADATARLAADEGAWVIETSDLVGGVGEARRIGMAAGMDRAPRWIMTTDADCVVGPGTVAVLDEALGLADAVFGRVVPDPAEFSRLPGPVRRHGRLEDVHAALTAEAEGRFVAHPWDPPPRHGQSPGALMAFRLDAYAATGGFPPVPCHEDKLMATALERIGARIARPWDAVVVASCRLEGRAPGGMADTIRARAGSDLGAEIETLRRRCAQLARDVPDRGVRQIAARAPRGSGRRGPSRADTLSGRS